jgi:hypothetical protein
MIDQRDRALPTVTKDFEQSEMTTWAVKFPSTMTKLGASYRATTYPGSDIVSLETWNTRRRVSALVARKRMPLIRRALLRAGVIFTS